MVDFAMAKAYPTCNYGKLEPLPDDHVGDRREVR
jgi:hypothetical protein